MVSYFFFLVCFSSCFFQTCVLWFFAGIVFAIVLLNFFGLTCFGSNSVDRPVFFIFGWEGEGRGAVEGGLCDDDIYRPASMLPALLYDSLGTVAYLLRRSANPGKRKTKVVRRVARSLATFSLEPTSYPARTGNAQKNKLQTFRSTLMSTSKSRRVFFWAVFSFLETNTALTTQLAKTEFIQGENPLSASGQEASSNQILSSG